MEGVHTNNAPQAIGPYSQAIISGNHVFTSGQIAINPQSGNVEAQNISEQTEQVCKNLASAGVATLYVSGEESLKQILPDFLGEQEQVPPNYSAIKINGVRASDLTHRGRNVTLSSRKIRIDSLVCLGKSSTQLEETGKSFAVFDMECRCSKGTYIRALCRDLGHALGTYGCVSEIRRTAIGNISVENAVLPSELSLLSLLSVDKILPYPLFRLHENQIKALRDGRWISFKSESAKEESLCFAANENGMVQALCSLEPGKLRPKFFIGQDNE